MAKTKFEKMEEEELKGTPIVEQTEEEEKPAEVKKERTAEEVEVTAGVKKVKIQVVEEVDCLIACVPYKLEKGKVYNVPSDVAAILCNAKKAYRV